MGDLIKCRKWTKAKLPRIKNRSRKLKANVSQKCRKFVSDSTCDFFIVESSEYVNYFRKRLHN